MSARLTGTEEVALACWVRGVKWVERDDEVEFPRISDLPAETPIALTRIGDHGGRYADFGEGMYCSREGTKSLRRARSDLWAVRHQTGAGSVWFYCLEHLPRREWVTHDGGRVARANERTCSECFLVVPVGSICEATGSPH